MTDLLPCPFCGGEAEESVHAFWHVGCPDKWCSGYEVYLKNYDTEAEAIAAWNTRATDGTLTAEQVRKAIFNGSSYASYDGAQYYANGISMQAIADELNSRAEQTCKQEERGWGTEGDHARVWLTCGHDCMVPTVNDLPNYCPHCGAKVVGE